MSAVDPVTVGHEAYAAALAAGHTPAEASRAGLAARERAFGHHDAAERADLLVALDVAAFVQGHLLSGIEAACGLRDRALSDGSTSTARLHEALATLRGDAT